MRGPLGGAGRWYPRPGTPPTRRNLEVLAASILVGSKDAAYRLGVTPRSVQHSITDLLIRLDVGNRWEAALALGWLRIPEEYMRAADPGGPAVSSGSGEGAGALSLTKP